MKIITPVTITDGMLVSSSIPETEHPAWNSATNYATGTRAIRASTHSVYQRLAPGGVSATPPESDPAGWVRVGPTNRWAMFDRATGTLSSASSSISVTLAPGLVRGLALLDVEANSVTVTMVNDGDTVYARTVNLNSGDGVDSWDAYFFEDIVLKRVVVLTDLPPYAGGEVTVSITGVGTVSVGTVAIGSLFTIGKPLSDAEIGIVDYSKKSTDEFGATTVVERPYANRLNMLVMADTGRVPEISRRLTLIRATPVVWIGSDIIDPAVVYGFYKSWSISLRYRDYSFCNLTIEGLS
jgi:hypothetical protein